MSPRPCLPHRDGVRGDACVRRDGARTAAGRRRTPGESHPGQSGGRTAGGRVPIRLQKAGRADGASPRQGSRSALAGSSPGEAGLGRTPRWTPGPGQCPPRRALLAWLWDVSLRRPPPPPVSVLALQEVIPRPPVTPAPPRPPRVRAERPKPHTPRPQPAREEAAWGHLPRRSHALWGVPCLGVCVQCPHLPRPCASSARPSWPAPAHLKTDPRGYGPPDQTCGHARPSFKFPRNLPITV